MPAKKSSLSHISKPASSMVIPTQLLGDVRTLITSARETVSRGVNAALVLLYWKVGGRIRLDVLKEKRAGYGDRIVSALATQLEADFGRSFAERNLRRMIQFS